MRRIAICLTVVLCGCRDVRPRWDVTVTVQVESQPSPSTKAVASLTLTRPTSQEK